MPSRPFAVTGLAGLALLAAGCAADTVGLSESPPNNIHKVVEVHYDCGGDTTISASYPTRNTADVLYQGQTHHLNIAISADGARYISKRLEWWTHGTGEGAEATLFKHQPDGRTGAAIEHCHQVTPGR